MEEVSDKGWLSGPYTLEEVQEDWLRVWRFAMHQNGKWGTNRRPDRKRCERRVWLHGKGRPQGA